MTKVELILSAVYVIGFALSYTMLKIEHEAEEKTFTRKDRIIAVLFSALSFITVLLMLVTSWFNKIGAYGYWDKPVKQQPKK